MTHFIVADRKTDYLLPPSVEDWLNEDHLARFVVEVVDQLDLSNPIRKYAGRGSKAYHPATLLAILVYGYATGKKPGGQPPKAPEPGVRETDQINLTDEESRIMPVAGGGFEQACSAQAGMDAGTMLVVATGVSQAPNDKEQVEPMLAAFKAQTERLGAVQRLIAGTGFFSGKNILACEKSRIVPLIAVARDEHHPGWRERHSEPPALPDNATPVQTMAHRLKTKAGRAAYALRKQTVEPVFGIIKSVMGFRQFSLRGLKKVTGEWNLS